jgi:cyclic beta-1,2-glucan synthetase
LDALTRLTQPALRALLPEAPEILCQLLDRARGPVQPPIRAEIFGPQRFAQHGRSLAQTHRATPSSLRTGNFFPRIKNNLVTLREAHQSIGLQASTGYDISPAAEWLLDNFHLIEAQLNEIHAGLPRSYFLPCPSCLMKHWPACPAFTAWPGLLWRTPTAPLTQPCWCNSCAPTRGCANLT